MVKAVEEPVAQEAVAEALAPAADEAHKASSDAADKPVPAPEPQAAPEPAAKKAKNVPKKRSIKKAEPVVIREPRPKRSCTLKKK